VGFWITAAQVGIALALGLPGAGLMMIGGGGASYVAGTLALLFLLTAEVCAAPAVVSEAALIYLAPKRNFAISLATILLQGVLTMAGMLVDDVFGLDDMARLASAAGALMVTLLLASIAKSVLLKHHLGHKFSNLRWSLLGAALPAGVAGLMVDRFLPERASAAVGIPVILVMYCWVIWHFGFGPDDRVLFRRDMAPATPELAPSASPASLP